MVKVLLDACVPQWLRAELGDSEVTTARFAASTSFWIANYSLLPKGDKTSW
jgi:hypothetical protein